jgi:hypothetical protein
MFHYHFHHCSASRNRTYLLVRSTFSVVEPELFFAFPVRIFKKFLFRFRFGFLKSYGSGSGCYFRKLPVPVPVPAPYLDHKKQTFQKKL